MRRVIRSAEFDEFYNLLPSNVQIKVKYALNIIAEIKVVNTKSAKKAHRYRFLRAAHFSR